MYKCFRRYFVSRAFSPSPHVYREPWRYKDFSHDKMKKKLPNLRQIIVKARKFGFGIQTWSLFPYRTAAHDGFDRYTLSIVRYCNCTLLWFGRKLDANRGGTYKKSKVPSAFSIRT